MTRFNTGQFSTRFANLGSHWARARSQRLGLTSLALLSALVPGCPNDADSPHQAGEVRVQGTPQPLSAPTSENCPNLKGASFTRLVDTIASARAHAYDASVHGDADAQAALSKLDAALDKAEKLPRWFDENHYDGTLAGAAGEALITMVQVQDDLQTATLPAVTSAEHGNTEARRAYEELARAGATANELAAESGRCYMDSYAIQAPPEMLQPAPVPSVCTSIDAAQLAPIFAGLSEARAQAEEDHQTHANSDFASYSQYVMNYVDEAEHTLSALDARMKAGQQTAGTSDVAHDLVDALQHATVQLAYASWWSGVSSASQGSVPGRAAFEAVERTLEATLLLGKQAGLCALADSGTLGTDIIRELSSDKTSVCQGDSITLAIDALDPLHPELPVDIATDHGRGAVQVFPVHGAPGRYPIRVHAETVDHRVEEKSLEVEIKYCAGVVFPVVNVRASTDNPQAIDLVVTNAAELARENARYRWKFGDGASTETTVPFVVHAYEIPDEARDEPFFSYEATLTVHSDGLDDVTTTRSINVHNLYGFAKARGTISPPVDKASVSVSGTSVTAAYTVTNREDQPLDFKTREITFRRCTPSADQETDVLPLENDGFVVPAHGSLTHNIKLNVPTNVCEVRVAHWGPGLGGHEAVAVSSFEVRARTPKLTRITDEATLLALTHASSSGAVQNPLDISGDELRRLDLSGIVHMPLRADDPEPGGMHIMGLFHDPEEGTQAGDYCVPGQDVPVGLECRATEDEWWYAPAEIENAYKGDAFMTPGCGIVGTLVRSLSPAQYYTHSGIFTRDFYTIRHSTASEDRQQDYPKNGAWDPLLSFILDKAKVPSDGFQEFAVKYGWPGSLNQSVRGVIDGTMEKETLNGKEYKIQAFGIHPEACKEFGDSFSWYPILLKPVPRPGNGRELVQRVADQAKSINSHYRFYSYSRGSIAVESAYDLPAMPPFATNTNAAVCSSLIWNAHKNAGVSPEGTLEADDIKKGAEFGPSGAPPYDGLYYYTAKERLQAGYALFYTLRSKVWNQVNSAGEDLGSMVDSVTDIGNEIANQMTNCFASDRCDAKDDSDWQKTGDGFAVSPDNLMFFDTYGHIEAAVFRPSRYMRRYRLVEAKTSGRIDVTVLGTDGKPLVDQAVYVRSLGSNREVFTNSDGKVEITGVPQGPQEVYSNLTTQNVKDHKWHTLEAKAEVNVPASGVTAAVLQFVDPTKADFRRVYFFGEARISDDENASSDDNARVNYDAYCDLNTVDPDGRIRGIRVGKPNPGGDHLQMCDDEVGYKIFITCELGDNRRVHLKIHGEIWEDTTDSCGGDDHEDEGDQTIEIDLSEDEARQVNLRSENHGVSGVTDWAETTMTIKNAVAP